MPETKIVVAANPEELNRVAANLIVGASREAIAHSGRFALALSGGGTPKKLYELLATPEWNSQIDWTRTHFFWGDERHVPPDHRAWPSLVRMRNAMNAPPSSRLIPVQSQPAASWAMYSLDHS